MEKNDVMWYQLHGVQLKHVHLIGKDTHAYISTCMEIKVSSIELVMHECLFFKFGLF